MPAIEFEVGIGPRVREQLEGEAVVWLTTVSASQTPQPNLIWFIWDGETVLVYTQPSAFRLKHVARNNRVSLNFNSDASGSEMSVLTGTAYIDESTPNAIDHPEYIAKYKEGIAQLGMTPKSFSDAYSVAIRIVPERARGF